MYHFSSSNQIFCSNQVISKRLYNGFDILFDGDKMLSQVAVSHLVKRAGILIVIILMLGLVLTSCGLTAASNTNPSAHLTSRFILWDTNEKMLDSNFTVHLIGGNLSSYSIDIDGIKTSGNFSYHAEISFNITAERINALTVNIGNQTVLAAADIMIINDVTANTINTGRSPFTINLNPREWSAKEWSIFWATIGAAIYSMLISYRAVKRYKVIRGVREVK